jgi:RNA polymerase Rpb1
LSNKKDTLVEAAYAKCQDLIALAKKGKLENKPGCNQEQTLEALISSELSKVREEVGEICMKELSRHNAPLIMATCGSKGISRGVPLRHVSSVSQVPLSTCPRWLLVLASRSSQGTVSQMDFKIAHFHTFPRNRVNLLQRDSFVIASSLA